MMDFMDILSTHLDFLEPQVENYLERNEPKASTIAKRIRTVLSFAGETINAVGSAVGLLKSEVAIWFSLGGFGLARLLGAFDKNISANELREQKEALTRTARASNQYATLIIEDPPTKLADTFGTEGDYCKTAAGRCSSAVLITSALLKTTSTVCQLVLVHDNSNEKQQRALLWTTIVTQMLSFGILRIAASYEKENRTQAKIKLVKGQAYFEYMLRNKTDLTADLNPEEMRFYAGGAILEAKQKENEQLLKECHTKPGSSGVNDYYGGLPPLSTSIILNKHQFTVLLLQYGADPNLRDEPPSVPLKETLKIIQDPINTEKVSDVKLLALYGGNSKGVYFLPRTRYIAAILHEKYDVYRQRMSLEEDLKKDLSLQERARIYTELSELWRKQCIGERVPAYLAHYQETSMYYQKKIIELNTDRFEYKVSAYPQFYPSAEQKSSSSKTNAQEELEPLLKANDSSKLKIS